MNMKISKKKIIIAGLVVLILGVVCVFSYQEIVWRKGPLQNKVVENIDSFEDETEFKFAIFGDTHYKKSRTKNLDRAVELIKGQDVDLVFTTGDNLSKCEDGLCKTRLRGWGRSFGPLATKLFVATGNHDVNVENEETFEHWREYMNLPKNGPEGFEELTYSFDYGNAHFVVLTTNKPEHHKINDKQLDWLKKDLKNNQKKNMFVFFHESAFPIKDKVEESLDVDEEQRDKLWAIIDQNNVTAVFSGHEHLNSRRLIDEKVFEGAKNGVYQFIVGNTNYFDHDEPKKKKKIEGLEFFHQDEVVMVVEVENEKVIVKTYEVKGELVEEFQLK